MAREAQLPVMTEYVRGKSSHSMIVRVYYINSADEQVYTDSDPMSSNAAYDMAAAYNRLKISASAITVASAAADRKHGGCDGAGVKVTYNPAARAA